MDIEDILNEYLKTKKDIKFTEIEEQKEKILNLLRDKKEKLGRYYCPCRMYTGIKEFDDKIVCPCEFHEEEINEKGSCHCHLLIKGEK